MRLGWEFPQAARRVAQSRRQVLPLTEENEFQRAWEGGTGGQHISAELLGTPSPPLKG